MNHIVQQAGIQIKPLPTVLVLMSVLAGVVWWTFHTGNSEKVANVRSDVSQFEQFIGGGVDTKKLMFVIVTGGILTGISFLLPKILEG